MLQTIVTKFKTFREQLISCFSYRADATMDLVDCTAAPRKYSKTLEDKGIVHAPNVVPGNKPITVGHQFSIVGFLPEQNTENLNIPWILPLMSVTQHIATLGLFTPRPNTRL